MGAKRGVYVTRYLRDSFIVILARVSISVAVSIVARRDDQTLSWDRAPTLDVGRSHFDRYTYEVELYVASENRCRCLSRSTTGVATDRVRREVW